jgi:hypothetical protein
VRRAALPSPDNVSSIPGQRVTHADRLSTGEPLVSLCPAERLSPTPRATGGVPGLWGVSRAQSAGTAYAEGHNNESPRHSCKQPWVLLRGAHCGMEDR